RIGHAHGRGPDGARLPGAPGRVPAPVRVGRARQPGGRSRVRDPRPAGADMTAVVMQTTAPRAGRALGLRSTMGKLVRRPEGLIGIVILLIFTVLAIVPTLLVG